MKLDAIQQGVINTILAKDISSLYLTGEGGSGKSEIIKQIISGAMLIGRRTLVLAPTNTAANNIGGVTIHKAFGLNLEINEDAVSDDDIYKINMSKEKLYGKFQELNIRPNDIVIIDEISMGGRLLSKIIGLMRKFEKERNNSLSTLLLVGDSKQLPPVKDTPIDWSTKCKISVELTKNYRTANLALAAEILHFRDTHDASIVKRVPTLRSIRKLENPMEYVFIAYKNATLSTLQTILQGDVEDWVGYGDQVNTFGSSTDHGVEIINPLTGEPSMYPYFTNGEKLRVISDPVELGTGSYKNLYKIEVENPKYKGLEIHDRNDYVTEPPTVITGDFKIYKKLLQELFHPINIFKKEMFDKYGAKTAKELKRHFTPDERRKWGKVWVNYLRIKNKPFARHHRFITSHKAQGQSIPNVCVLWDELAGDKLKYVAISRAKEKLVLITKLSKG